MELFGRMRMHKVAVYQHMPSVRLCPNIAVLCSITSQRNAKI